MPTSFLAARFTKSAHKTCLTALPGVAALAAVPDLLLPVPYEYFHNRRRRLEESEPPLRK